jgi:hypothetical protein
MNNDMKLTGLLKAKNSGVSDTKPAGLRQSTTYLKNAMPSHGNDIE